MHLSISLMLIEITRLFLGLTMAAFHRQIADFILEHERNLVVLLRQRGLMVPPAPTRNTAHTLYFCIGLGIAFIELARIYMLQRGI
ncbi:MAG TPA: hypothetical protein VE998_11685 [Terriglobales bacterium]|nr:hypothetical protein [Terriglobales bacterium]